MRGYKSILVLFLCFSGTVLPTIDAKRYPFCPVQPISKTIDEQDDSDGMNALLKKYAPVGYLYNNGKRLLITDQTISENIYEPSMPITVEEFFTSPETSIAEYTHAKGKNPNSDDADEYHFKKPLIRTGKVTMKKLYDLYQDRDRLKLDGKIDNWEKVIPRIPNCAYRGSNPSSEQYHDSQGNLTVPIYAAVFTSGKHIYLQYYFFYGHNPAYNINALGLVHVADEGQHQSDLEHMTLELNRNTHKLERIFYGAHGPEEGIWMDAQSAKKNKPYFSDPHDQRVEFEDGTHPVTYLAYKGHGNYPHAGVYVRAGGHANDYTSKDIRWKPKIIRVYEKDDPNFDPSTMGWIYGPGKYGPQKYIPNLGSRPWFLNIFPEDLFSGNPANTHFCGPSGNGFFSWGSQGRCMVVKAPFALSPKHHPLWSSIPVWAVHFKKMEDNNNKEINTTEVD